MKRSLKKRDSEMSQSLSKTDQFREKVDGLGTAISKAHRTMRDLVNELEVEKKSQINAHDEILSM